MTPEQRISELETDNAQLREQVAYQKQLQEQLATQAALIAQLVERIQALETRLSQDSHNSSKPPSSDGFIRSPKKRSLRKATGKKAGGQSGHQGHALQQVEQPDVVIEHFPTECERCQHDLTTFMPSDDFERRQVFELPLPLNLDVIEHRSHATRCPNCQHVTKAAFPKSVTNWVQYGPGFRALAVYLVHYQLLPYGRACELLNEIYSESLSPGTLAAFIAECADHLVEPEKAIKAALRERQVMHCDESGLYVEGRRQWVHVASTEKLTHYACHPKRGSKATDEIGILPAFKGTAVHDGYYSYTRYECEHALCNAHHLRELNFVAEQLSQGWAAEFKKLLVDLKNEVEAAKAQKLVALSPARLAEYEQIYQTLIKQALAANPPPVDGWPKGKRGRPKQTKAKNLIDRLDQHRRQVLLFAYRFEVPFDNNQAERDIRMVKVQQKISGCFRSEAGAKYFCRIRGYLSTMKKQGQNLLFALLQAFGTQPLLPTVSA
jgi:transposase